MGNNAMRGLNRREFVATVAALAALPTGLRALDPKDNANVARLIQGRTQYQTISGKEPVGYEDWRLIVQSDGTRTMESTVINTDRQSMRSMVHQVAANFRPLECYLTYYGGGKRYGSGWFHVDGNDLFAVADTPNGRVTQEVKVPDVFSMVPHPTATDGWHFWGHDRANPDPQIHAIYNQQTRADNAGSVLGRNQTRTTELTGSGETTVPAGTFPTDQWKLGPDFVSHTTGQDSIPIYLSYEKFDREFVCVRYEEL